MRLVIATFCLVLTSSVLFGQALPRPAASAPRTTEDGATTAVPTITVERQALMLRSPDGYRTAISLQAAKRVNVAARMSGTVSNVYKELGQTAMAQEEVARLDQQVRQLELDRAQTLLKVAQLEHLEGETSEFRDTRISAAQSTATLAQLQFEETQVRAPFAGTVIHLFVQPGDYVAAGSPVLTLIDGSTLTALIPVERSQAKPGDVLSLQVEGRHVDARVMALLPPPSEFESLRDLFTSLAAAHVSIDNANRALHVGQTVISDMIPRHPIAEVPNRSVLNGIEGERKVQVLREGFVRDLPVQLLGNVGDTHVFVSARFQNEDELIVTTSEPLTDGTWLRPKLEVPVEAASRLRTQPRSAQSPPF